MNASAASLYPIKMLNFGFLFFSPMCIAFKTVVCVLLIVRAAFLDDGLKKIRVLFLVVAVWWPSGLEGSVSSGSLWPGAEQKRDPGLKMAADRQVQPTEPDKGTNDTQRCHHLWRKKQNKKTLTHIEFNMAPCKEGRRKIKTQESLSDTKVACCARTSGTVHTESIHYNSSVHACWPPFGMLEGIVSGVKWRQDWRKCTWHWRLQKTPPFPVHAGVREIPTIPPAEAKLSKTQWMSLKKSAASLVDEDSVLAPTSEVS